MSTIQKAEDFEVYGKARTLISSMYQLTRKPAFSKGSLGEIRALLQIAFDQTYITAQELDENIARTEELSKMMGGLSKYLQTSDKRGRKFIAYPKHETKNTKPDNRGFAIISTLLVLTVLTIMVVAFLQSMRVERLTARSYMNKTRADLAAQAASQKAIAQIIKNTRDSGGMVDLTYTVESVHPNTSAVTSPDFTSYSPITVISRYEKDSGGVLRRKASPLISSSLPESDFQTGTPSDFDAKLMALFEERGVSKKSADLNNREGIQALNSSSGTITSSYFRVPLLDITDPTGQFKGKYGFLVLDEQARLNPVLHRSAARDQYARTASEMPVSTGGDALLNAAELISFSTAPALPATPFAIGQYFGSTARAKERKHLFGYYSVYNQDVIPAGYADAGKPKYNLNDLATQSAYGSTSTLRAENIGTIINNNLPDFKTRDPSFTAAGSTDGLKYINRLAAGIVDYIDSDSEPTTVNSGEPAGKDLYPMVCGIAENVRWVSKGVSPGFICTFESRYYVQIWNPYTVAVTGSARLEVLQRPTLLVGGAIQRPLSPYDQSVAGITVRPNEFVVLELPAAAIDSYQSNSNPDSPTSDRPRWELTSSNDITKEPHPYFKFYWNNSLVDMNRRDPVISDSSGSTSTSGLPKALVSTTTANRFQIGQNRWSIHFMQQPTISADGNRRVSDPRINWLSNYDWTEWVNTSYANGKWGGRQDHSSTKQDFVALLAARDYVRANPNLGVVATGTTQTPSQAAALSTYNSTLDGLNAPFFIRNDAMLSIGELGHIFDPAQAADNGNASPAASSVGPFGAGGGRSLQIGQPELAAWNSPGKRAMQLLDLFTVNEAPSATGFPQFKGRININTASAEVLQTLFYNIEIKSDEGFHQNDSASISKVTEAKAKILAEALVKDRTDKGYYTKLSDLYRIFSMTEVSGSNPAWNRSEAYTPPLGANSGANTAPEVMDRAREELFAKTVNLIDTQSRAFRIFSTGQALGPLGTVVARSYLETVVELKASTDGTGVTTLTPHILYERYH